MTARACIVCGGDFTPSRGHEATQITCGEACRVVHRREHDRTKRQPVRRNCLRCGTLMEARDRHSGNKRYCSDACRFNTAAAPVVTSANAAPCEHCGTPFEAKNHAGRRKRYCSDKCRVAHFKARSELDGEGEIPVKDLEESPRRLAVAKLFDRFDCGGAFDHFTAPTWMNPADRRASR